MARRSRFFLYQPLMNDDRSSVVPDNAIRLILDTGEKHVVFAVDKRERAVPRRGGTTEVEDRERRTRGEHDGEQEGALSELSH